MKKVLVGLFLAVVSVGLSAQNPKAVGTYKLDPAQTQNAQWKSATLVVTKNDDSGIAWKINGTGQDGKPVHETYASGWDKEAPIKGASAGETGTWHKDGTFDIKLKDGSTSHLTSEVSEDGKTMTVSGNIGGKDVKDVWVRSGKAAAGKKKAAAKSGE